jgi:hypothetical protein
MGHEIFAEVIRSVLGKRSSWGTWAAGVHQKYSLAQVVVESALAGEGNLEGSEFRAGVVIRNRNGGAFNIATFFPFWRGIFQH